MMLKCGLWKIITILLTTIFMLQPLSAEAAEDVSVPKTIRVGFFAFEGFHEYDEIAKTYSGYGYDMIMLMQKYANLNFVLQGYNRSWEETQQDLLEGKIDMAAPAIKTEKSMELYDFSLPVGVRTMSINVRHEETRFRPGDFSTYDGMVLGLLEGNSENDRVEEFARDNGFSFKARYYADSESLKNALLKKEVDAVAASSLRRSAHERTISEFNTEQFYIIVKKGNSDLLQRVNYAILQMNESQSAWQASLYHENYRKDTDDTIDFTSQEREFIRRYSKGGEKLVIATDTDWAPFSWRDKDGYHGIIPEILARCMKLSGMQYEIYDGEKSVRDARSLYEKKANLYIGYCLNDKIKRDANLLTSTSLVETSAAFLVRRDTAQIEKVVLAASKPYLNMTFVQKPGQTVLTLKDTLDTCQAVLDGKADAAYMYNYEAEFIVNSDNTGLLAYQLLPASEISVMAVMRADDDHTLMSIFQKCLGHITQVEKSAIVSRHVSYTAEAMSLVDYMKMHPLLAGSGILMLAGLLAWSLFSIKRRRDEELHNAILQAKVREVSELNRQLTDKQIQLEESACEQEAQLEEITALNELMQEKQDQLKAAAVEREAQMKEISILNSQLKENTDIIRNAGYGIWRITLNSDGRHLMTADDVLQHIWGIEKMNLSPEALYKFYHERLIFENVKDLERLDYAQMQKGDIRSKVLAWQHPEKGLIYISAGGTLYIDSFGRKIISGYCGDVTKQQQESQQMTKALADATQKAMKASKAKSDFLFNMSHDIRTPMNAILGFTTLMKNNLHDPEQIENYLDKVETSGKYLLTIINNVLDMARIESGNMKVDEAFYDFNDEKSTVQNIVADLFEKKRQELTFNVDVEHNYLLVDHVKMKEIMVNLLSNASKYTPEGGKVSVSIKELPCDRAGWATIQTVVSDNGIGMSREFVATIFEAFTREKSTTESKVIGTGLGMAIVKKLVDLLGGTIRVESELGKGSTFTFTVSYKIAENPEQYLQRQTSSLKKVDEHKFSGKHILLAEDNDLNAEIATILLENEGFVVDRAVDGVECVGKLTSAEVGSYDLILMDVQMPNMGGYEATQKIRRLDDSAKASIPIVAMTANAFDEDRRRAKEAGMNAHLAKPFDMQVLMKTLESVLSN